MGKKRSISERRDQPNGRPTHDMADKALSQIVPKKIAKSVGCEHETKTQGMAQKKNTRRIERQKTETRTHT